MSGLTVNQKAANFGESLVLYVDTATQGSYDSFDYGISFFSGTQRKRTIQFAMPDPLQKYIPTGVSEAQKAKLLARIALYTIHPRLHDCFASLLASGQFISGVIGPGETAAFQADVFSRKEYKLKYTSELVGARSGYPTFREMHDVLSKWEEIVDLTFAAEGRNSCLNDWYDPSLMPMGNMGFGQFVISALMSLSAPFACHFVEDLYYSIAKAAITDIEEVEEGKVRVTWSQGMLQAQSNLDWSDMTLREVYPNLIKAIALQKTGAVRKSVGEYEVQVIDENSIYGKYFNAGKGFTYNPPGLDIASSDIPELTDEEVADVVNPDIIDEDITPISDVQKQEWDPDNVRVINIPEVQDQVLTVADCDHLEDDSAPLELAAELGVLSQADRANLKKSLEWHGLTEKQLKKKVECKKVKPDVRGDLNKELSYAETPVFKETSYRSLAKHFAGQRNAEIKKATDAIIEALGEGGSLDDIVYVNNVDKTKYVVITSGPDLTDDSLPGVIASLEDPDNVPDPTMGRNFWDNALGSPLRYPLISTKDAVGSTKDWSSTKKYISPYVVLYKDKTINLQSFLVLGKIEYDHCVNAYKERAEEGTSGIGLVPKDSKSYWWLLLLIIPLVALLFAVNKATKKIDEQETAKIASERKENEKRPDSQPSATAKKPEKNNNSEEEEISL